jgi:hypothetical protein
VPHLLDTNHYSIPATGHTVDTSHNPRYLDFASHHGYAISSLMALACPAAQPGNIAAVRLWITIGSN